MKVLVTGGSGFIGQAVLRSISQDTEDHQVLCLTRNPVFPEQHKDSCIWQVSSMEDFHIIKGIVDDFDPEVLIHLAWEGIPDFSLEKCLKNLEFSSLLLQYAVKKESLNKVLVSGSCFEYSNKVGACHESDQTIATDYFTWSKLSLLNFLKMEAEKNETNFAWLRIFYAYGENQRQGSLIPMLVDNLKNRIIPDIKTPLNSNDFVFVDDIGRAFSSLVDKDFKSGIYNLGRGEAVSVLDVCRTVEEVLHGNNILSDALEKKTADTSSNSSFFASTELSYNSLGWKADTSLKQGIMNILGD